MSPEQFRAIRHATGWTQTALGDYMRVKLREIQRWEAGDHRIPGPVEVLMEQLAEQYMPKPKKKAKKAAKPS